MSENVRRTAVAGMFYPGDADELHDIVARYLSAVELENIATIKKPIAIIAPHAGYIYSGPIAASVYARLIPFRNDIQRVILLGPSHRVPFRGLAASSATYFSSPLGDIPVDQPALQHLIQSSRIIILDEAHAQEHSLEVHLPFLQEVLGEFSLIPLVVGDAGPEEISGILESLWKNTNTLIVVSSDLSHYQDYATAQKRDRTTSRHIENLDNQAIQHDDACGRNPVNGLINFAKNHHLSAKTIDLRNSGDTAGTKDKVVGYGAYVFE